MPNHIHLIVKIAAVGDDAIVPSIAIIPVDNNRPIDGTGGLPSAPTKTISMWFFIPSGVSYFTAFALKDSISAGSSVISMESLNARDSPGASIGRSPAFRAAARPSTPAVVGSRPSA